MRKTSFEYHIHGYRYAPESFHIYKGLPGQEKTELPLSDEQRYQMGYKKCQRIPTRKGRGNTTDT